MTERIDIDRLARECGRETVAGGGRDSVLVFAFSREELTAYTRAVLEEAAKVAENGRFLTDDSAEARFGKSCAAAIRKLMP